MGQCEAKPDGFGDGDYDEDDIGPRGPRQFTHAPPKKDNSMQLPQSVTHNIKMQAALERHLVAVKKDAATDKGSERGDRHDG